MATTSAFSISDALSTLSTSVPDWNRRLEELNSQIALRQIELARLTETERPSTRSLKNKGSTESLRPQDGEQNIDGEPNTTNPFDTPPKSNNHNGTQSSPTAAAITPPLSNQRPTPIELSRKPSASTPVQTRMGVRKRKTESMASAESQTPKYRTRSMIIVYYDSAVQTAFEDLVKFVSASRNSMRKGKMNAKMEAMRRAAEKEADNDNEEDSQAGLITSSRNLPKEQSSLATKAPGSDATSGNPPTMEVGDDDGGEVDLSQLRFVSTRNMGPPRGYGNYGMSGGFTSGMMGRNARSSAGAFEANDIFDELDKGLEWCQSQCERAAHQFLRDGDCSDEIEGIKKRLLSVKEKAEQEVEKLKKEAAENPPAPRRDAGKSREMRPPQMRKTIGTVRALEINKKLEAAERKVDQAPLAVDKMEVDEDEGYEDVELPPMMTFRRTRDMGRS